MNKLKLSLITIATIVASNTNAQTFYQCLPCPAGTYASNGTCTPCPAGTYSQVSGATSSAVCTKCPAGTYSASTGATSSNTCQPCAAGTYASSAGSKSCTSCPAGQYQNATGQASCKACTGTILIAYARWTDSYYTKTFKVGDSTTCSNSVFGNPDTGDKWCCARQNGKAKRPNSQKDWSGGICVADHTSVFTVYCDNKTGEPYAKGNMGIVWQHQSW
ncbi:hypothetical protein HDR59_05405 [bacterium]|nr:hypothetical protein [bacterium]